MDKLENASTGVMVPQFNIKPLQLHHSRAHQIYLMSFYTLSTCPCLPQHLVQTGETHLKIFLFNSSFCLTMKLNIPKDI